MKPFLHVNQLNVTNYGGALKEAAEDCAATAALDRFEASIAIADLNARISALQNTLAKSTNISTIVLSWFSARGGFVELESATRISTIDEDPIFLTHIIDHLVNTLKYSGVAVDSATILDATVEGIKLYALNALSFEFQESRLQSLYGALRRVLITRNTAKE